MFHAIALLGAVPVVADVDDDLNIDPKSVGRLVNTRTRAIVPVHYAGRLYDTEAIAAVADAHGLRVVEDGSHAFGAHAAARRAGSFGDIACFSANPMKVMASLGEAGLIVTDDDEMARRIRALLNYGLENGKTCIGLGLNARLDTFQAAVLSIRLDRLPEAIAHRRAIAERYRSRLNGLVRHPLHVGGEYQTYFLYPVQTEHRDALMEHLASLGVEAKVRDRDLGVAHPPYASASGEAGNARRLIRRVLCLPMHEKMSLADADYVCDGVADFVRRQ